MSDSMIERVAQAMKAENNSYKNANHYEVLAKAAIASMREPTEAMFKETTAVRSIKENYQVMIDAALKED